MAPRSREARTKPSVVGVDTGRRPPATFDGIVPRGTACGDIGELWLLQRLSLFSPRGQQRTLSASAREPAIPWVLDLPGLPQAILTATVSWISLWPIPAAGASAYCSVREMAPFNWR